MSDAKAKRVTLAFSETKATVALTAFLVRWVPKARRADLAHQVKEETRDHPAPTGRKVSVV